MNKIKLFAGSSVMALVLCVVAFGIIYAAVPRTVSMYGTAENIDFTFHFQAGSSAQIPADYDWGVISEGETILIYGKNAGNTAKNFTISVLNEVGCSIALTADLMEMAIGEYRSISLTFTNVVGDLSWQLYVDQLS